MILPERVFGSSGTTMIWRGFAIGPIAKPRSVLFTEELPKTRSGKIMRRLLRDIAEGRELGDVTTLRDPDVMSQLEGKIKERGDEDA